MHREEENERRLPACNPCHCRCRIAAVVRNAAELLLIGRGRKRTDPRRIQWGPGLHYSDWKYFAQLLNPRILILIEIRNKDSGVPDTVTACKSVCNPSVSVLKEF